MNHLALLLKTAAEKHGNRPGLTYRREGRWQTDTWSRTWERALEAASLLERLGLRAGDRAAIWSENRPEWVWTDMGGYCQGTVTVPIYVTLAAPQIRHILEDSGARVLFVSNAELLQKITPELAHLPKLEFIVLFDKAQAAPSGRQRVLCLANELKSPSDADRKRILESISADRRQDLATIIYTSGTTGVPKGVMLTHGNFLANRFSTGEAIRLFPEDIHLSFLPLSHVFERLCGYYLPIERGAQIAYAENMDKVPENMREVRPTILMAVPRFYEKIYGKIQEKSAKAKPVLKKLFDWAIRTGSQMSVLSEKKQAAPLGLRLQYALAGKLVYAKVKKQLGGRIRFCVSGGAPLAEPVARFFHSLGILIIEGYGLTETSPVMACNRLDAFKFGTVGLPIGCAEIQIASDGEILTKGPCIMKGYFGLEKETAAALEGGWFHTGDLGNLDKDGFLKITGRKKEIIVTSGGKKVSPDRVEAAFQENEIIQRCILCGEGKNFLTALIVPNFEVLRRLAAERGASEQTNEALAECAWAKQEIEAALQKTHRNLAPFEQVKYFKVLSRDFSIDEGELTPTLKARRSIILKKYAHFLEPFYKQTAAAA